LCERFQVPLYFAYGSNMDATAMARRCPRSRLLGRARMPRWRLFVMPSGFVSVAPDPRANVHGALWDVAVADVAALDRYEQVGQGLYAKKIMRVLREPLGSTPALIYIGADPAQGSAWRGYLADIVAAGQALGLPSAYVDYLSSLSAAQRKGLRE